MNENKIFESNGEISINWTEDGNVSVHAETNAGDFFKIVTTLLAERLIESAANDPLETLDAYQKLLAGVVCKTVLQDADSSGDLKARAVLRLFETKLG